MTREALYHVSLSVLLSPLILLLRDQISFHEVDLRVSNHNPFHTVQMPPLSECDLGFGTIINLQSAKVNLIRLLDEGLFEHI